MQNIRISQFILLLFRKRPKVVFQQQDGKLTIPVHPKYFLKYNKILLEQISSGHNKLNSAKFKAKGFKMKKCFSSCLSSFIKPRSNSILIVRIDTVYGDICYTFSRLPESKSPEKYTLLPSTRKQVLHDLFDITKGSFSIYLLKVSNIITLTQIAQYFNYLKYQQQGQNLFKKYLSRQILSVRFTWCLKIRSYLFANNSKFIFIILGIDQYTNMAWIFDACGLDYYGWCLRQCVVFSISIVILGLTGYSCYKTYKLQNRVTFELLPISINLFSSLLLVGIYSQKEIFITRLILMIIQDYSYFILTYGFVFCVMKSTSFHRQKLKNMKKIFIVITILSLIMVAGVILLYTSTIKSCTPNQGITSIINISIQTVLMIIAFIYGHKTKITQKTANNIHENNHSISELLILKENHQIRLNNLRINMVRFAFTTALVLQIMQITVYYFGNPSQICFKSTDTIQTNASIDLYIICLQNTAQLFPHCMIPFIFWYIPARIVSSYNTTYFIKRQSEYKTTKESHKIKDNKSRQASKLAQDLKNQHYLRQRMSPRKNKDQGSQ